MKGIHDLSKRRFQGTVWFPGGILLSFMLVQLLSWAAPELPLWVCYGVGGAPITALGVALFCAGIQKFKSFNPLSDQSAQALKETMQWKTNPK